MLSTIAVVCSAVLGVSTLSGQVTDVSGRAIAGAKVFLEPGLEGVLREMDTDASGNFSFEDVSPGAVGVFAIADGCGFSGRHVNVATGDAVPPFTIMLSPASTISGTVVNHKGKPIAGALVTRVALLGEEKVGIPLSKLTNFGFRVPESNADGKFIVPNLPQSGRVALKVGHPSYAQEGTADMDAGATDVKVTLHEGVVVMGDVVSRSGSHPVGGAIVTLQNAQPPHDTAVTSSDGMGVFSIRLKPGVYLYKAQGGAGASPGWERLTLTEKGPAERVRLIVAGTGALRGKVADAKSGKPIAGARLSVKSAGNLAAIVRTGETGEFSTDVCAGESTITLESAPGYYPSTDPALSMVVEEGKNVELPGFWLMPIPTFKVQVLAEDGATPAPGVLVTVMRPRQFGCSVTDAQGWAELTVARLPDDGKIVGMAEDPAHPLGALFSMGRDNAEGARVQLFSLGEIHGRVLGKRDKPLPGVAVGALFPEETANDTLLLWRTVTSDDGTFTWTSVVPGVPFCCAACAGANLTGRSKAINLAPGQTLDLGDIAVPEAAPSENVSSMLGKSVKWYENEVRCGTLPDKDSLEKRPAAVVYCLEEEATAVAESVARYAEAFAGKDIVFAVVVRGTYHCDSAKIPVLGGTPPGAASTYVIGRNGAVVLETFGLPPLRVLQGL